MALYTHDNHDDIPFFSPIKMFQELKNDDKVFILNLDSLLIEEVSINNLKIEEHTETVTDSYWQSYGRTQALEHKNTEYKYSTVEFSIDSFKHTISIHFGTETSYCRDGIVVCTTKREAEHIKDIIEEKCQIQVAQFKHIFNGYGWNYAIPNIVFK